MKGNIITMDALHCTEETILATVDKGANLLVGVKDNSSHLKKAIIDRFDKAAESEIFTDTNFDKGHGRVETRITEITSINTKSTNFSHLNTIAKSIRKREIMRNGELIKTQNETQSLAVAYCLPSIKLDTCIHAYMHTCKHVYRQRPIKK